MKSWKSPIAWVVLRGGRVVAEVGLALTFRREIAHALVGRTLPPITRVEGPPLCAPLPLPRR